MWLDDLIPRAPSAHNAIRPFDQWLRKKKPAFLTAISAAGRMVFTGIKESIYVIEIDHMVVSNVAAWLLIG